MKERNSEAWAAEQEKLAELSAQMETAREWVKLAMESDTRYEYNAARDKAADIIAGCEGRIAELKALRVAYNKAVKVGEN